MSAEKKNTKGRILESTEKLIAEHGFDAVSLRDITNAAGVNVAAVNYHFGSKENLFEEIQCRHIRPINEERIRLLQEAQAGDGVAKLRDILEAFMRPVSTPVTRSKMSQQLFLKLMGRFTTQQGCLPEPLIPQFKQMGELFTGALQDADLDLPVATMLWRLHYTFGVMAHTFLHGDVLKKFTEGACGDPDIETQLQGMIDFCHAGFLADVTEKGAA